MYRRYVFYNNANGTYTLKRKNGWSYTFGASNLLETIKYPNGNTLTLARRGDGTIIQIITPEGHRISINYEVWPYAISSITGPSGTVSYTYYNYGMNGTLQSVKYPDGSSMTYHYDSSGRMTQVAENGHLEVTNVYDANSRVVQQTHSDGGVFTFDYTVAGGNITQTSITAPNSSVKTWRFYDDSGAYRNGYITKMITPDGTTTYNREAGTNLILSVADPLGRQTSYTYYPNGQIHTRTDALGNVTTYAYEPHYGHLSQKTNALGKTTTISYTYDSNNRITRAVITDPLSHATTINYNSYGKRTSVTDANGNTTTSLYENIGYPAQLTQIVDPLGNATHLAYDSLGRAVQITNANGKNSFYAYDLANRITSVTDANGNITQYLYDGSNLTLVIDPKGGTIQYAYDSRNRITQMTDQLGRQETYTYCTGTGITATTGGNLKSITGRKGQTTTFNSYDGMNRLTRKTHHDQSYTAFTYDAAGRMTSLTDSISGAINFTYNDFGCTRSCGMRGINRLAEESTSLGTVDYTYDAVGRRATMTVAGEPRVGYAYYDDGRLDTISRQIGSGTRTYTVTYDNAGRRATVKIPLSTPNQFITSTYGYDAANRLTGLLQQGPSTTVENLVYEYDPVGRVKKSTRNATQPLRPSALDTSYDAANEMLAFTPSGSSAKSMTYDANGNLATVTNACGVTTYRWDVRNRLTGITGYNAGCTPLTASFTYDGLNRCISKTINGTTTQYLYEGAGIIQEITATGAKTNYVRTLAIDEPLTRIKPDGTIRHYAHDRLGSVVALTDDKGATQTTYTYDPFGNTTVSGQASDNPFQFTGRENDGTGLYYYRARYYSPELQRFISEEYSVL